jgi:5'(3')-deoxyribonucleotidase
MVELELEDYNEIFKWFNEKHDEVEEKNLTEQGRKSFWKLHFLMEDKIMELEEAKRDREPPT